MLQSEQSIMRRIWLWRERFQMIWMVFSFGSVPTHIFLPRGIITWQVPRMQPWFIVYGFIHITQTFLESKCGEMIGSSERIRPEREQKRVPTATFHLYVGLYVTLPPFLFGCNLPSFLLFKEPFEVSTK
jgi:hypothetical protein